MDTVRLLCSLWLLLPIVHLSAQTDLELTGGYNISDPSELIVPIGGELTMFVIISNTTSTPATGEIRLELDGNGDYYITYASATKGGSPDFGLRDASGQWTEVNGNQTVEFTFTIKVDGPMSGEIIGNLIFAGDTNVGNNEVTFPISVQQVPSISGTVWDDQVENGFFDNGESGVAGWAVFLDENSNSLYDDTESVVITDANGEYTFENLEPREYRVGILPNPDWSQTFPVSDPQNHFLGFHLIDSISDENADFGVRRMPTNLRLERVLGEGEPEALNPRSSELEQIRVQLWNDFLQDAIGGIRVDITGEGTRFIDLNTPEGASVSGEGTSDMEVLWESLPGNSVTPFDFTVDFSGSTDGTITVVVTYDGDLDPGDNTILVPYTINPEPVPGAIYGNVWRDTDRDGEFDPGEPDLADWTVFLDTNLSGELDEEEPVTKTDADGAYAFDKLPPGTYRILPVGYYPWKQTFPVSTPPEGFTGYHRVELEAGEEAGFYDFGLVPAGSITIAYFNDLNENGIKDEGETSVTIPVPDPGPFGEVFLNGESGGSLPTGSTTLLEDILPGNYTVRVESSRAKFSSSEATVIISEESPEAVVEFGVYFRHRLSITAHLMRTDFDLGIVQTLIETSQSISEAYPISLRGAVPGMHFIVRDSSDQIVAENSSAPDVYWVQLKEGIYSVEMRPREGFKVFWSFADGFSPGTIELVSVKPVMNESSNSANFAVKVLPPEITVTNSVLSVEAHPGFILERADSPAGPWIAVSPVHSELPIGSPHFRQRLPE